MTRNPSVIDQDHWRVQEEGLENYDEVLYDMIHYFSFPPSKFFTPVKSKYNLNATYVNFLLPSNILKKVRKQ